MKQQGYLVIADLTGYTAFLTQTPLEEAHKTLTAIFQTLLEHTRSPLVLSKLEGDALFSYALDGSFTQGQTLLESIEQSYLGFRTIRDRLALNADCDSAICTLLPVLDLKFAVHHGEFIIEEIAGRQELSGPDVILTHRLLKNTIAETTGHRAYALITDAAAAAMQMGELAAGMHWHTENYDYLGDVSLYIHDLDQVWERSKDSLREYIEIEDAWFNLSAVLPVSTALAWDYLNDPDSRRRWAQADEIVVQKMQKGRLGIGTEQACRHGSDVNIHRIVDWKPFEYATYDVQAPLNTTIRYTIQLSPTTEGTQVSWRFARPNSRNPFHRFMGQLMSPFIKGFLHENTSTANIILNDRSQEARSRGVTGPLGQNDEAQQMLEQVLQSVRAT